MAPGKFDQFWAARYPAEQTTSSSFWSSVADRGSSRRRACSNNPGAIPVDGEWRFAAQSVIKGANRVRAWKDCRVPQARKPPVVADEKKIRALLETYAYPVPFHEIRTRFLGNIATPAMSASPISVVKNLWGGELPEFESLDAVNELIGVLVNGLWNSLTRHQKRSDPFRLVRPMVTPTRVGLAQLALIRRQELDGFVEGLFSGAEELDLPAKASAAFDTLGEVRAMIAGVHEVASDAGKPADLSDIATTMKHLRELTRITEIEINRVVLDCTRARRQMLGSIGTTRPTHH
jgi:hypothetical protein